MSAGGGIGFRERSRTRLWTAVDTAVTYRWPLPDDHKYSRGVLGLVTGSQQFPGAAVLSAAGALHTGLGMLRYLGAPSARERVLDFAPEVVPAPGRTDAYAVGSGLPELGTGADETSILELQSQVTDVLHSDTPVVIDAGALGLLDAESVSNDHTWILTPHTGEYARLARRFGIDDALVRAATAPGAQTELRAEAASALAEATLSVVLLKGSHTVVSDGRMAVCIETGTPWHATAGTGDVLTGVIGALLAAAAAEPRALRTVQPAAAVPNSAAHGSTTSELGRDRSLTTSELEGERSLTTSELVEIAASGAWLHGRAGQIAEGPFTAGELATALSAAVRSVQPRQR